MLRLKIYMKERLSNYYKFIKSGKYNLSFCQNLLMHLDE